MFTRLGMIVLFAVLFISGCVPAIQSRPAGSTGIHAASGSLEMTGQSSFVAYTNTGTIGSSMGIFEFPEKVGKEFYIEMDINYPLESYEQSISIVFPGGIFGIHGNKYFFRSLPIPRTGINMNQLPIDIDLTKIINVAIYRNQNEAFAYLNNEPVAQLIIKSQDDNTPVNFSFYGPARKKSTARIENYSIVNDSTAKEYYIAIQQRYTELQASREKAKRKSKEKAYADSASDSKANEIALAILFGLGAKLVKETVRGFKEMGSSSPVVMAGDDVYVCGSRGLCSARALEVHSDQIKVRYTSKDCEYHDKMDFDEYLRWIEDPVQWVAQGKVATESDINSGRFRCH